MLRNSIMTVTLPLSSLGCRDQKKPAYKLVKSFPVKSSLVTRLPITSQTPEA
ncbi:hypothetical protein BDW72DRAFT_180888 [Aspergillus terricola var. indicus]